MRFFQGFVHLTVFVILTAAQMTYAQISSGGTPRSFSHALSSAVPTVQMIGVDNAAELALDAELPHGEQNRFATDLDVQLELVNSGFWEEIPGGRLWRLRISSPGAHSIGLLYDQWNIPKGGELFVFNDDHSQIIGAFTSFNNWIDGTNVTQHVAGDAITLEYFEPDAIRGQSTLSVSKVCHAYRNTFGRRDALDNFGDSESCNVNINCSQVFVTDAKNSVAMVIENGVRHCSGSLVITTDSSFIPYFLTSNTGCVDESSTGLIFMFNHESPNCSNINGPTTHTVANATWIAGWDSTFFALLRLSSWVPAAYTPYFNGWHRGVSVFWNDFEAVHHPAGDIKKWSNEIQQLGIENPWFVQNWDEGSTDPGSQGGPVYYGDLVVGQLATGNALCEDTSGDADSDYIGIFAESWNGGGGPSNRLRDYLDPILLNPTYTDGSYTSTPPNDVCGGVTYVSNLPATLGGNTAFATHGASGSCVGNAAGDVWYALILPCSTQVTASLCGSTYDTGLYVRRGTTCDNAVEIACNDDYAPCGLSSQVTFNTSPTQIYYIIVDGYASAAGEFTLNLSGTIIGFDPAIDTCPGRTIASLPYQDSYTTTCANNNYSNCVGATSRDVVYTMLLAQCRLVTATLCGSGYDSAIEVRTDGPCPGTTSVACNDDFCALQSQVSFLAAFGVNYYIIVHGFSTASGPYTMNVTGTPYTPSHDTCPGAAISSLPYTDTGNTRCATNNFDAGCVFGDPPDVLYHLYLPACQTVTVSLCGSGYDTGLSVRTGGSDCPGATEIACNDDAMCNLNPTLQSVVSFIAAANTSYYIIVDGYDTQTGMYTLNVTGTPFTAPNDVCPGTTISSLPYTDTGDTRCANNNYDVSCIFGDPADVIYSLNLSSCQSVTVSLCGSGYDTGLSIRTGGTCPGSAEFACNDDFCALQSQLTFTALANTTYFIIVDGYNTGAGPFTINVTGQPCAPPDAPDSLVVRALPPNINLYWPPVPGAASYKVYRKATPDVASIPADFLANAPSNSYVDAGVVNTAAKYFYLVTAISSAGPAAVVPSSGEATQIVEAVALEKPVQASITEVHFVPYANPDEKPKASSPK